MTSPIRDSSAPTHQRASASFWIAMMLGGGIMAFGIRGAVMDLQTSAPAVARWVVGADLLHDFIVAPLVVAIGWCVHRTVPDRWRVPIQAGLFATAITLVIGWPGWRGYGRHLVLDNPSVQPLDYTTAILTVLAVVWGVVAVWLAVRLNRSRSAPAGQ